MGKMEYQAITEKDTWPICPYCEKEIKKVKYYEQTGIMRMKVVRIFVCPHCNKVLGNGMVGG